MADNSTNEALETEPLKSVDEENSPEKQAAPDETEQNPFTLTITKISDDKSADSVCVESTDERFTMDDLSLGDNYEPIDIYFIKDGKEDKRRVGGLYEGDVFNRTMPRLACEIFKDQLLELDEKERENLLICKYKNGETRGIFTKLEDYKKSVVGNLHGMAKYEERHDETKNGTKRKSSKTGVEFFFTCYNVFSTIHFVKECLRQWGNKGDKFVLEYRKKKEYLKEYSDMLCKSKNLIFRGAPGTGKSYLAKKIAAYLIIGEEIYNYENLKPERKKQISEQVKNQMEFVQFHPSYDYSDFVEGLRPKVKDGKTMVFELRDGIFKKFVDQAKDSYEAFEKSKKAEDKEPPKYVFIIDEINRGDISKIFGELFFSIDPGYRGKDGEITTQYTSKFYIPENVYIIGTMNDIDRSVDSFDFAMRRRFRFVELEADKCIEMLDSLKDEALKEEAINRMKALNKAIASTDDLNKDYQIGAAYFLKLEELNGNFNSLWKNYLEPLLQEYIRGFSDEKGLMEKFKKAYNKNRNLSKVM